VLLTPLVFPLLSLFGLCEIPLWLSNPAQIFFFPSERVVLEIFLIVVRPNQSTTPPDIVALLFLFPLFFHIF